VGQRGGRKGKDARSKDGNEEREKGEEGTQKYMLVVRKTR
jgi:hypothetical protein